MGLPGCVSGGRGHTNITRAYVSQEDARDDIVFLSLIRRGRRVIPVRVARGGGQTIPAVPALDIQPIQCAHDPLAGRLLGLLASKILECY